MNQTKTVTEQWYLWQIGFAYFLQGIVGILSFGIFNPSLGLYAARALAIKRTELTK